MTWIKIQGWADLRKPIVFIDDRFRYRFTYLMRLKQWALPKSRQMIGDKLATKNDLIELENNLRRNLRELESRIIIKLGGLMAVSIAVVAMLVKLL